MSTTDTKAAFEAHYRKDCEMPDSAAFNWDAPYMVAALDGWQAALAWQAATKAAKATGTACTTCNDNAIVGRAPDDYYPCPDCATEAARQPAPVDDNDAFKEAYMEWSRKTDWVQEQSSAFPIKALGMHRADVMREEIERLRAALAATAAPVLSEADERDNEIFELQKALAFWLPQVNQFMSDEMSQRIARDAYMLVIDGNLPDDFKTAQELGWILPATGKVQRDAEMVCGNCMEPIPTTVMDTSSTRAPATALSDESIDELAKHLTEQCVIVYGDMRRFARAIIAATRSQP